LLRTRNQFRGDIAGYESRFSGDFSGFVIRDGVLSAIPPFPGGENAFVYGMNDRGWIVGGAGTADSYSRAFLYHAGEMQDLGFGGSTSFAMAVNGGGLVVGFNASNDWSTQHAIAWRAGAVTDMGASLAWNSRASAVNDRGIAIGYMWPPPSEPYVFHAAIFVGGQVSDLGALPGDTNSQALAINDEGVVVGSSMNDAFQERAFIHADGAMRDLNEWVTDPGGVYLLRAKGINSAGIIIAEGTGPDGAQHAVVLLPVGRSQHDSTR
jgi:probable HAF family extracellular repeat protein